MVREHDVDALVSESSRIPRRLPRRAKVREQRQPMMGEAMPFPLVVPRQHDEADPTPPVGEVALLPAGFDAKADLPLLIPREQEPLDSTLEVPLQRVVAKAEGVGLIPDAIDDRRTQKMQA